MKIASDTSRLVSDRLKQSIEIKQAILDDTKLTDLIVKVAEICVKALDTGRKIIFFGNGGSAADAQHLAAELTGRYLRERRALAAIALTANTSSLTAIANDYGYETVFSRQIEAIAKEGDIAMGISTSGESINVLRAMRTAQQMNLLTVGLTGSVGGQLRQNSNYCLCVPSEQTPRIQEAHILLGHILCEIIEESFLHDSRVS
jgi:D-sedoheptulose 7-phosphate isomerase